MGENPQLGPAKTRGIHNAGVHELICYDHVLLAEQRADRAEGGGVASGKTQGRGCALESGDSFLQFMMGRERTANEPGSA